MPRVRSSDISDWTISYLARLFDISAQEIDVDEPFERYGLDSTAAAALVGDIGDWLGLQVDATTIYDHPTVRAFAGYLERVALEHAKGA